MTVRFHLESLLYAALVWRIGGNPAAAKLTAQCGAAHGITSLQHLNGRQFGVCLSAMALSATSDGGVRLMGQMTVIDSGLLQLLEPFGAATAYGVAVDSLLRGQASVDLRFARMTLLPLSGDVSAFDAMEKEADELGDQVATILAYEPEQQAPAPIFSDSRVSING